MDQDANRLDDDLADALGDDEILILDYDLDAPEETADGLYSTDAIAPVEATTVPDAAEVSAGNVRNMVVEHPGGGGKVFAVIGIPLLLLGLAAGAWLLFFQSGKGKAPSPTRTRRTATREKTPPVKAEPVDPTRAVSVASVVGAGDPEGKDPQGNDPAGAPVSGGTDPETTDPEGTPPNGGTENASGQNTASTGTEPNGTPTGTGSANTAASGGPAGKNTNPTSTADGIAAFGELTLMALANGFGRLEKTAAPADGMRVQLKDGRVVQLALGESLVQLKNGNHFKGNIVEVNDRFLTLSFAFGKMKIPQGDLNDIVDRNSSDYLPLKAFKTGVLHLKNGNRLTGKIVKITPDRVVLGFPSAKIVVSRGALKDGLNSVEYTQADSRERYYGVAKASGSAALGLRPGQRVETLLGVPYYDFEYGFRIIPPKHWNKYSKDAIVGFDATPISPLSGNLTLGGLFLSEKELAAALERLPKTVASMPNTKLLGNIQDVRGAGVPWAWQFDCAIATDGETSSTSKKRCRTYVFTKARKVFILSVFALDARFDTFQNVFALTAKSFEFKN